MHVPPDRSPTDSPYRWLFSFVRPHRGRLACVLFLSLASTGLALTVPYFTKLLIDDGLLRGQYETVVKICFLLLVAGLFSSLLGGLNRLQYVKVSGHILFDLRESVYRHLQRLSPSFHARIRRGDVLTRIDGDVAQIQRFGVDTVLAAINGSIALAGTLALMITLSWKLSLLAFIMLPAQFLFLKAIRPSVETQTRNLRERTVDLTSFFIDRLSSMKLINAVGAEAREASRLAGLNRLFLSDLLRLERTQYLAAALPRFLSSLAIAGVFLIGGYMAVKGSLTVGSLIAFSIYLTRATGPVQTLLGLYVASRRARVSLDRVLELMVEAPAVSDPQDPVDLPADASGHIEIENVSYQYAPEETQVLVDASAVIPGGSKVGVMGPSGIGKTTLIDLLHRYYDPSQGRIRLDGTNIREFRLRDLRRHIAVVAQDTIMIPGTIADNIRYAVPTAKDSDIVEAATSAQIAHFIELLPNGYETEIGQRGDNLSGGQRQRIAIARALLQQPLVLILDEATSEIDTEAEARIVEEIDRLFADRTRIIISHRKETLHGADLLLEIANGRLNAVGAVAKGAV